MKRLLCLFFLVTFLTGCTKFIREEDEYLAEMNSRYRDALTEMSRDVRFDSRSGVLGWDNANLSDTWMQHKSNINRISSRYQIKTSDFSEIALKEGQLSLRQEMTSNLGSMITGKGFVDSALEQLERNGFAVVQRGAISGASGQGKINVPALLVTWIRHQRNDDSYSRFYTYSYDITTRPVMAPAPAIQLNQQSESRPSGVQERLQQLQKLYETGIVSKEEYEKQRAVILRSL